MTPENDLLVQTDAARTLSAHSRYIRYMRRCDQIRVRPASFPLWQQIEPWLIEHGRVAVLEIFRDFHDEDDFAFSEAFAS